MPESEVVGENQTQNENTEKQEDQGLSNQTTSRETIIEKKDKEDQKSDNQDDSIPESLD